MLISRLGNKQKIAPLILPLLPPHTVYVELFFGAGGLFFNKPKAKYNFLNDIDEEVYNFFVVLKEKREEFVRALSHTPYHPSILRDFLQGSETDPVWRAVAFLYKSNFTFYSRGGATMRMGPSNERQSAINEIERTMDYVKDAKFLCRDFRDVVAACSIKDCDSVMIYADPPYADSPDYYKHGWSRKDTEDLFSMCNKSAHPFAISEFETPTIKEMLQTYDGLHSNRLVKRTSIKNSKQATELLITNYITERLF